MRIGGCSRRAAGQQDATQNQEWEEEGNRSRRTGAWGQPTEGAENPKCTSVGDGWGGVAGPGEDPR